MEEPGNLESLSGAKLIHATNGSWTPKPPASVELIRRAEEQSGLSFPDAYRRFLRYSNGGSGDLPVSPGFIIFWHCEELAESNQDSHTAEALPGFYGIGSSGGGDMFVFDTRESTWPVYIVPFIGMEESQIVPVARDFEDLLCLIGKGTWP